MDGIPADFSFDSLPPDMDHFEPILERAIGRLPILAEAGIQTWFNGPESFTPDDRYLLGETAEVRDLFVACGFNSIGIQSSGGVGKVLSEWIRDRHPPMDLADVDVRRMQPFQSNRRYLRDRTVETLGLLYAMHWPYRQVESARGCGVAVSTTGWCAGACMGEMSGWERPNCREPGVRSGVCVQLGRQNWFAATGRNASRCATGWRCSTSPPSRSSWSRGRTRWPC
jgi:4-methylaminobutanoate oxidase (formaldehyde-forming)